MDLPDLVVHQPASQVELVDAHVHHDPAAYRRIGERDRRRLGIELKGFEQDRPAQGARHQTGPGPCVVGIPPPHEPDLKPNGRSFGGGNRRHGVGHCQRNRFLAEDVLAGACRAPDGLQMLARGDRDKDGVQLRRRKQIVQRAEYCRVAELAGEPTR